jgi:peptide/nickel transport system permease protein
LLGTLLPTLLGGSVIIEQIFSVPGMGRLGFEAILSRDYPLVMGILAISALLTLVGLILSDILYAVADPRIRFE